MGIQTLTEEKRRQKIEKERKTKLTEIAKHGHLCGIENIIGATQVPIGITEPVKVNGKKYRIPLATTEAALVASVSRGCKAITKSGGAVAIVLKDRMTRTPSFKTKGIKESQKLARWVDKHFKEVKKKTEEKSKHLTLKKVRSWVVGRNVFFRFECETDEAMGMNMTTIGVANACDWIENKTKNRCLTVTGNLCVDKKASAFNLIEGRGKTVTAEVVLKDRIIKKMLHTTIEKIMETHYSKHFIGSALSGAYGYNTHFANMVAAMFIATGQDAAHVVEGSQGFTVLEKSGNGLSVTVHLPSLQLGIIGGGTKLPTQKEALKIIGAKSAKELANVMAAGVLAGEISALAALSAQQLTSAHEKLRR